MDIWYTAARPAEEVEALSRHLSSEERQRYSGMRLALPRSEYLLTRVLLRMVLSTYADVEPGEWRFVRNRFGRPYIASPNHARSLRFNLSNTRGLIVCAVSSCTTLGVDVEAVDTSREGLSLARRFFCRSEVRDLESLPGTAQRNRFLSYWTLKESYIKATGEGLEIPLDSFSFGVVEDGPMLRLSFGPPPGRSANGWHFLLWRTPAHFLALATRSVGDALPVTIQPFHLPEMPVSPTLPWRAVGMDSSSGGESR